MDKVYEQFRDIGIIPVVAIEDASKAADLAHALVKGGLPASEVTFRTACAAEAIEAMIKAEPDMLVGAGTVLNVEQAEKAVKAGAKFIVSPGYNPDVVDWCIKNKIPTMPGISNPSEITACINKGLTYLKLFPAERKGGYKIIDDFGGPFPQCAFMPTGGVTTENVGEYAKRKNILCMGGTWMVKKPLIEGEKWDEITQICKDAVKAMHGFHIDHMGINAANPDDATAIADGFAPFGFAAKVGNSSIFASDQVEIMKQNGRGTHGHISMMCNNVERALAYLKRFGFKPVAGTEVYMTKGNANTPLKVVYLDKEVGGFAIHLKRA